MVSLALLLLIPIALAQVPLKEGVTETNYIANPKGGEQLYSFNITTHHLDKDLIVTLTTLSDISDPNMYMSDGSFPSEVSYKWKSVAWGPGAILLKDEEIRVDVKYYVLVECNTSCSYDLTYAHNGETELRLSIPQLAQVSKDRESLFRYTTTRDLTTNLTFTVTPFNPNSQFQLAVSSSGLPTPDNSLPIDLVWPYGQSCVIFNPLIDMTYRLAVLGLSDMAFMVSVVKGGEELTLLPSNPVRGTAKAGEFAYFKIAVTEESEVIIIKMTTFAGEGSLFMKRGGKPSLTNFDFRSEGFANDTIFVRGEGPMNPGQRIVAGTYYIGVYGYQQTVFTIYAALNFDSWIPIYAGMPQGGAVMHRTARRYYMEIPAKESINITFRVSPIEGNPNLYVRLCTEENYRECDFDIDVFKNPENHPDIYYSRHREGDDSVYVQHFAKLCTYACRYIIAVTGRGMGVSRFLLSGSFDERDEYVLMQGFPVKMTLQRAGSLYYRYTVFDPDVTSITFQLTPIMGNPDLFLSRNVSRPSQYDNEKNSTLAGAMVDSVTYFEGSDGVSLVGEYHIAVTSGGHSTFSLVAHEYVPGRNTTILLYPGEPQQGTVRNDNDSNYRLYQFEVHFDSSSLQAITVALTPLTGEFHMYVANSADALNLDQGMFFYNWCTCLANNSNLVYTIIIKPDDPYYRQDGVYLVMVQGTKFAQDDTASFIISYRSDSDLMSLQESIPYSDEVHLDQYKYYTFPITQDHEDINIQLTALTGDPDLYILINSPNMPSKNDHDFASMAFAAGETISIQWEQIKDKCPTLSEDAGFGHGFNCYMNIAVYGYSEAVYSIAVTMRRDMPRMVSLGVPASGELNKTLYDFYYTLVSASVPLMVHLQPLYGDSDLFLNLLDYGSSSSSLKYWRRPSKDEADYKSQSAILADSISVSNEDLQRMCLSGTCIALSGVYCFSAQCKYSITISQDDAAQLLEGIPVFGEVDNGFYNYYKFYNQKNTTALLITVTPLNNGDPDLFVSRGTSRRPTVGDFEWSSQTWRGENLLISSSDPLFNATHTMRGYYTIGVRGYYNTSYILTVTTNPDPVSQIIAGVPVQADVESWKVNYYSYFNYRFADINVVLTPLYGAASLRVNSFIIGADELYDSLPSRGNATWSSSASGIQNRLIISSTDPRFCSICAYVIGVFADAQNCSYSITVSSGEETVLLQNGIPVQGQVEVNEWRFYTFYLNTQSDVDISLTNFAGDSDLYASTGSSVDANSAFWTRTTTKHVEHIHVRQSDPHFQIGQYSIGVKGVKNSSYSITAHARDSYITLVDGWPQTYSIMYNSRDHLKFEYYIANAFGKDQIFCHIQSLSSDFWPRVFTSYKPFRNSSIVSEDPGPKTGADLSFDEKDYDKVYKSLGFELEVPKELGEYVIAIYGKAEGDVMNEEVGTFELSCFGQSNSTVLMRGREQYGSLSQSKPRQRFELYINQPGLLEVSAEPCAGRISMTVSTNYTTEENTGSSIVVSRIMDGRLQASIPNALGQYFITLKMLDTPEPTEKATFQVSYQFYEIGQNRPKKIVPGNDGMLRWIATEADMIDLSWSPPEYEDGSPVDLNTLFVVYVTNNTQVKMSTVCGMRAGEDSNTAWESAQANIINNTTFSVRLTIGETQFVNVIAIFVSSNDSSTQLLPYTPTEVFLRARRPRRLRTWIVGLIAVGLVIALGSLFVLWNKYKKVKKTLENEMQDVRNVASISSEKLDDESIKTKKQTAMYEPLEMTQSR